MVYLLIYLATFHISCTKECCWPVEGNRYNPKVRVVEQDHGIHFVKKVVI